MDECVNKFMELLQNCKYLSDEKVNIHRFLSMLSQSYENRIEFDESKNIYGEIKKVKHCYEKYKNKIQIIKAWKELKKKNI